MENTQFSQSRCGAIFGVLDKLSVSFLLGGRGKLQRKDCPAAEEVGPSLQEAASLGMLKLLPGF